jgi:hypothetical protein
MKDLPRDERQRGKDRRQRYEVMALVLRRLVITLFGRKIGQFYWMSYRIYHPTQFVVKQWASKVFHI